MGVGGVTVISGGNLATVEGMKSFGMLGGTRERIRLGSGSFDCSLLAYCCWSGQGCAVLHVAVSSWNQPAADSCTWDTVASFIC